MQPVVLYNIFGCVLSQIALLLNAIATLGGSYLLRPIINTYIAPENGIGNAKGLFLGLMVMAGVYLVGIVASLLVHVLVLF